MAKAMPRPPGMGMQIARRLIAVREELGLDQGKFAEGAGLSPNAYNQYESGKRVPDIMAAIYLCDAYNISMDWIYRGEPSGVDPLFWNRLRKRYKPDPSD